MARGLKRNSLFLKTYCVTPPQFQSHSGSGHIGQPKEQAPQRQGAADRRRFQGHLHHLQEGHPRHNPGEAGQDSRQGALRICRTPAKIM